MELTNQLLALWQRVNGFPGFLNFLIDGLHDLSIFCIGQTIHNSSDRDIDRGQYSLHCQRHLRRANGRLFERSLQDSGESDGGMTQTSRNRFLRDTIKPRRRILDSDRQVVMIDQKVVVFVGHDRAGLDHLFKPVVRCRHGDSRISTEFLFE